MDAENILCEVAEAIYHSKLEAVMIGNAAAAIQGAPVTTMDIDFCIKDDETEIAKLEVIIESKKAAGDAKDLAVMPLYNKNVGVEK
jgi:hypothetical protein